MFDYKHSTCRVAKRKIFDQVKELGREDAKREKQIIGERKGKNWSFSYKCVIDKWVRNR